MTRFRIRPKYSDEQLAELYSETYDGTQIEDHQYRIAMSVAMLNQFIKRNGIVSVADLSAGDASIINALDVKYKYIGDITPGHRLTGPIEETIKQIPKIIDLFILSETLEHLDDPDAVLQMIGAKAASIFVSTPLNDYWDNPQHYWLWDRSDITAMLANAGYVVSTYASIRFPLLAVHDYGYQLHIGEKVA
jgi:hypothetical protein